MSRIALFAGLLLVGSSPLLAQTAPPVIDPPAKVEKPKEKLKCRLETPIGSLVPRRQCFTAEQLAAARRDAELILTKPEHMEAPK